MLGEGARWSWAKTPRFWALSPGFLDLAARGSSSRCQPAKPALPVIYKARHSIANELQSLDDQHNDHDSHEHHFARTAGIAVAHRQLAQPAATHGARHHGVGNQRDNCDGPTAHALRP